MNPATVRTRFAPSPTGELHIGNARTALFNWLYARHYGGRFILRSEDTDRERSDAGALEQLECDLAWLGLEADEGPCAGGSYGPYRQCERGERHRELLAALVRADCAYPCYCTRDELAAARQRQLAAGQAPRYPGTCARLSESERAQRERAGRTPTLRFRVPDDGAIRFVDLVHGEQRFRLCDIGDFVIARADGTPAFFFANAVDDADMAITHVLRGDDHLTNTPRQLLLLQALELPAPAYGHFGLLTRPGGQPLSKREGAATLRELRARGYRPEAVRNHLARVGVAGLPPDCLDDGALAAGFDLERVSRGPAVHDPAMLDDWQRAAVDALDDSTWLAWVEHTLGEPLAPNASDEWRHALAHAVRPNVLLPGEAQRWAHCLLAPAPAADEGAREAIAAAGSGFFEQALALDEPDPVTDFRGWVRQLGQITGCRGRRLYQPLRAALTGTLAGPELGALVPLLGRDGLLQRLDAAAEWARQSGVAGERADPG